MKRMSGTIVVEGPIKRVTQEEKIKAIRNMKPGKTARLSEVNLELLTASGETGIVYWMEES